MLSAAVTIGKFFGSQAKVKLAEDSRRHNPSGIYGLDFHRLRVHLFSFRANFVL